MSLVIDDVFLPATLTSPPMNDDEFIEFCGQYPDYAIEVSAEGDILIMPPSDPLTSAQIGEIFWQLSSWSRAHKFDWVTESSGGFVLPNGARHAPDVACVAPGRLPDRRGWPRFPRFAPDDRLSRARFKMREWVNNGAALAWLVDAERQAVEIYRPGGEPETFLNAGSVAGEVPVQGFVLDLRRVWDPIDSGMH